MATVRQIQSISDPRFWGGDLLRIRLFFYIGVPGLTAILFGLNQAGMARVLPTGWAVPYWLGLTVPLWLLLDLCSRAVHFAFSGLQPHRWLMLLGGALLAMALFSPYVPLYVTLFVNLLPEGTSYSVKPAFPEAFLDLRRFVAYSGVPIYWIAVALFFARYFSFPPYLTRAAPGSVEAPEPAPAPSAEPELNEFGLPMRSGFRALMPYHLGLELVSLSSEDHYVRVVTDRGNALIRYRFSDALTEVKGLPGIQVHRSHWVAIRAIERVIACGKAYRLILNNGTEVPVSRTNVGVLRASGLL
jgi:hypothetical protein